MRALGIGAVVVTALVFGGWVAVAQLTDSGSSNLKTSQSVDVVLNDMDSVRGKRISVSGNVKTSMAPWAVLLGSSDATQVGLLVVPKSRLPQGIRLAARVNAIGIARPFSLAAFRRSHPGISQKTLARSPLRSLDGQPAVVAADVALQR